MSQGIIKNSSFLYFSPFNSINKVQQGKQVELYVMIPNMIGYQLHIMSHIKKKTFYTNKKCTVTIH